MTTKFRLGNQRSFTGNHTILIQEQPVMRRKYSLITWTFGRASVIWKIWPAVFIHTIFAAVVTTLTLRDIVNLRTPNFMLTVLGVVIGFIISYRACGGYDRYWLGRTYWSELGRNTRTLARLIWFHVPPRLTPRKPEEEVGHFERPPEEVMKVMGEKMLALDLIEGFAVALKHHVRDELGIYYHDLYHLVRPLHDQQHPTSNLSSSMASMAPQSTGHKQPAEVSRLHHVTFVEEIISPHSDSSFNPLLPSINSYGTFYPSEPHTLPSDSLLSNDQHQPPLTTNQPQARSILSKFPLHLVPFYSLFTGFRRSNNPVNSDIEQEGSSSSSRPLRLWRGPTYPGSTGVVNQGDVLPLEILCHLSNWFSTLEDRGTVPGSSLGQMIGALAMLEDTLSGLERIITTPLPFIYSVHIRTVWIYLFLLPFQIVEDFGWFTIPAAFLAAFIYLGFLSAGEEIEQPFGYDEDDLDLDLFCLEIHLDMKHLKGTPCGNSYLGHENEEYPKTSYRQSKASAEAA